MARERSLTSKESAAERERLTPSRIIVKTEIQSMPEIEPGTSVSVGKQATPAPPELLTYSSHLKHYVFKSEDKCE